ncbi:MAG: amidase, partial [Pseudomonadota bacterium]|nr:amidase [Pseudomonadota bacterium]
MISDTPKKRSYFAASSNFADGSDSPRDFLDRCISEIEARETDVKAFEYLNLDAARSEADAATERWRNGNQLSPIDGMPVGV